ncbi:agmatinase [Desulfonatronospira sp.]|uniref:agmatinase n=1 Tax=Desulfonatronospira sp. TaxID=1962951 RepID=UPI0025C5F84F|nr:agmatinase [Desulfonatronospira sp.]
MYLDFLDLDDCGGPNPVHVWPVPYQGTVSFDTGTRNGPEALLKASYQIETYDAELDADISDYCCFKTLPFQRPNVSSPENLQKEMHAFLEGYDPSKDFILTLGGEHSIAFPPISFYAGYYPDLTVIQVDAHADLRNSFQGSSYSHACVMSRVKDLGLRTVSLGIRSMDREQAQIIKDGHDHIMVMHPWNLPSPARAAEMVKDFSGPGPVYITFDVDGMDPCVIPGTGTPEPGGLQYHWINDFWRHFWPGPRLVGMDFCELAPRPDSVLSESTGVKCILKILLSYFRTIQPPKPAET